MDLAMQGKLDDARALLVDVDDPLAAQFSSLLAQQQRREGARAEAFRQARHEMGNALSIAQASIEAMLDGVVGITDPRLNRIREILAAVSAQMYELTSGD